MIVNNNKTLSSIKTIFHPGKIITVLLLSLFAVYIAIPFLWMFATSFRTPMESFRLPPSFFPTSIDLENYRYIFTKVDFFAFIKNSIFVSVMITVLQVTVSSMAAYSFSRLTFPGKNIIFTIFLFALMIPAQVTSIPRFILISKLHLINSHAALILPAMYSTLSIFLIRQHMLTIPKAYDEAAYIDGAGKIWTFTKVILPMAKPSIFVVSVMTFIGSWNDFFNPLIYINTISKMTLPVGLQSLTGLFGTGNQASVIGAVMLSLIPPLLFYIFGQRWLIEGLQMGGIKG
jgi:multiple sugar transport system permease protein